MRGERARSAGPPDDAQRSLRAGVLVGIALMAAVDEIVFHQLLGWHHFYDGASAAVALASDGVLHAAQLLILVAGGAWMISLRGKGALRAEWARAGLFLGLGGFQLFDGIVDHKVLRLHQIRYGVDLLPYDVVWNASALLLLLIGVVLVHRARGGEPHAQPGRGLTAPARG